jgi:periplasmic protein CpxP/Spy
VATFYGLRQRKIAMKAAQRKVEWLALTLLCGAAFAAPFTASAQDAPPPTPPAAAQPAGGQGPSGRAPSSLSPEEREQRQLDALSDRLTLTADQQAKIKQVLVDRDAKLATLRSDDSVSADDKRTKTVEITQDGSAKIRALLTADQQSQYDDFLAHQRQRGQGRGGNGGPPPSPPPATPATPPSQN